MFRVHSSRTPYVLGLLGGAGLGGLLLRLFQGRPWASLSSNEHAAYALAWLGLAIAVLSLVSMRVTTLTVDSGRATLQVSQCWWWGRKRERLVPFARLRGTRLRSVGKPSSGLRTYFLQLELVDGEVLKTDFASTNAAELQQLADQLDQLCGQAHEKYLNSL